RVAGAKITGTVDKRFLPRLAAVARDKHLSPGHKVSVVVVAKVDLVYVVRYVQRVRRPGPAAVRRRRKEASVTSDPPFVLRGEIHGDKIAFYVIRLRYPAILAMRRDEAYKDQEQWEQTNIYPHK